MSYIQIPGARAFVTYCKSIIVHANHLHVYVATASLEKVRQLVKQTLKKAPVLSLRTVEQYGTSITFQLHCGFLIKLHQNVLSLTIDAAERGHPRTTYRSSQSMLWF